MKTLIKSIFKKVGNWMINIPEQDERLQLVHQEHQVQLVQTFKAGIASGNVPAIDEVGFKLFSQFEEDGILLYLFTVIGSKSKRFVDVGANDGLNSNCANLAINWGWHGLLLEGDASLLEKGKLFYNADLRTCLYPPIFKQAMVGAENINDLIKSGGFQGEIDLLSIDIDGNDFWVWKAIEVVDPRVVVIETHVEFGERPVVVPYDPDYVYPGKHPQYHGASPKSMIKLGSEKGYRLVATNRLGFNFIFIKESEGKEDILPTLKVEDILAIPRNVERRKLTSEIEGWDYIAY